MPKDKRKKKKEDASFSEQLQTIKDQAIAAGFFGTRRKVSDKKRKGR